MIKKVAIRLALVAALATTVIAPSAPANATVTGAVAFHCTANLPAFPAAAGNGTCGADTLPSVSLGVGAGLDDSGNPYVLAGPGTFTAAFSYNEACVAAEPPLLGTANGAATVAGATAVHSGSTTSATLTTNFSWTRVGAVAVILTSNTKVAFGHGGTATAATADAAVAAFAPILSTSNICPAGGPLKALVVGADVQPA